MQVWINLRQGWGLPAPLYEMDPAVMRVVQILDYEVDALVEESKPKT